MKNLNKFLFLALAFGFTGTIFGATERYCLSLRDDPATTIVVGWEGDNGSVYYGTTDHGTSYTDYSNNHASDRTGSAHGHSRHFARLTGLTPNTVYYFVIRDNNGTTSQRFSFQTLSDDPSDPVSFISGGDSRQAVTVFGIGESCESGSCRGARQTGNRIVAKVRPDFIAFNGDMIRNTSGVSDSEQEWDDWFDDWQLTASTDGRMYAVMLSQGNHEDNSDMYELFDIPQDEYYAIDVHGGLLRLYSLNSELNVCSSAQTTWFENDLQLNQSANWKFVQYHIPTLAVGNGYGLVSDQMSCWGPLFLEYGVQLAMESHTHVTKWTYPSVPNSGNNDFEVDNNSGTVYIGEGQWGAPWRDLDFDNNGTPTKPWIRDQGRFDNFFFVRVTENQTTINCVKFENESGITAATDDLLGQDLPSGVTLWNPTNGDEVVLSNPFASVTESSPKVSNVFPVPANDIINIEFKKATNATIEVYNSLGKMCQSETVNGAINHQLDTENMCTGVNYIYILSEDGTIETHKVIKQ